MGKGRNKKNKRSARPSGGAVTVASPETATPAASGPAPPTAPTLNASMNPSPQASLAGTASRPSFWQSEAAAEWKERLHSLGVKIGTYALLLFGVYWVLAAWFSTWGFEGKYLLGTIWWTLFGDALIAVGWYLSNPDGESSQATEAKEKRSPPSLEDRLKAADANLRLGGLWLLGGLIGTVVIIQSDIGGMAYVPAAGALVYGGVQVGIGLLERFVGERLAKALGVR
jgi:hypothetical protein